MKKITIFRIFFIESDLEEGSENFFFFFLPSAASESEVITRAQALGCKAPKIAILATENPKK